MTNRLEDIRCQLTSQKTWESKSESQFEYNLKVPETVIQTKQYLEGKLAGASSVIDSDVDSLRSREAEVMEMVNGGIVLKPTTDWRLYTSFTVWKIGSVEVYS